jgi:hypothetical protein
MRFKKALATAILLISAATTAHGDIFGVAITSNANITGSQNLDLSQTGNLCGRTLHYTGAGAGTLTVLATAFPNCNVTVVATSTGLATIATAGGTFKSNTVCTATPRTKEAGSAIWVHVISNAGSAPVIGVYGDCG